MNIILRILVTLCVILTRGKRFVLFVEKKEGIYLHGRNVDNHFWRSIDKIVDNEMWA